jgi:hypothetical protein
LILQPPISNRENALTAAEFGTEMAMHGVTRHLVAVTMPPIQMPPPAMFDLDVLTLSLSPLDRSNVLDPHG